MRIFSLSLMAIALLPCPAIAQVELFVANFVNVVRIDSEGNTSAFVSGLLVATDVAFDSKGNLYVTDNGNGRKHVKKFSSTGEDLGVFLDAGAAGVVSVAVDGFDNVFVGFDGATQVNKYAPDGTLLAELDTVLDPSDVIIDSSNNVYVCLVNLDQVRKYTNDGQFIEVFASLDGPVEMAFDSQDNLYVSEISNDVVRKFASDGTDLGVFAAGGLVSADGLALDPAGNLYVGDNSSNNVRRFSPEGADLGVVATGINVPIGIASRSTVLLGDVNRDGVVDLLDVQPFVNLILDNLFQVEGDINKDGVVDLLDVVPFVDLISG